MKASQTGFNFEFFLWHKQVANKTENQTIIVV